jgi:hypothetical protein
MFSLVQETSGADTTGSGSYQTSAFGSNVTVGNTIICVVTSDGNGDDNLITSVTDNLGNTYVKDAVQTSGTANRRYVSIWRAPVTVGGACTITVNFDDSQSNNSVIVAQEWSVAGGGALLLDITTGQSAAASTSPTTGASSTTAHANELVVAGFVFNGGVAFAFSAGSGYSNSSFLATTNAHGAIESKEVSATAAQTGTCTLTASRAYSAVLATYYVAGTNVTVSPDVAALTVSAPDPTVSASISLASDLVSYWKFDESSGDAADSHGDNDLTNAGSAAYATGKINNGIDLEASSHQYLVIGDSFQSGLDITGNLTIAAWIKLESLPTSGQYFIIADKGRQGTIANVSYNLGIYNSSGTYKLNTQLSNGTTLNTLNVPWTPSTGTWYHVALTYNVSTKDCKFYVNGAQQGTTQTGTLSSINNDNYDFHVGAVETATGLKDLYFDGIIDELGIWKRELALADIEDLYNNGDGLQYPFGTDATVSPDVLSLTASAPAPTISAIRNVAVAAAALSLIVSAPAVSVSAVRNASVSPAVLELTASAPTASVEIAVSVSPDVLALSASAPAPTVSTTRSPSISPATLSLAVSAPAPTVSASGSVTVTPDAVGLALSAPTPTITATRSATVSPAALTLAAFAPAPTISVTKSASVSASVVALSASVPSPTITASRNTAASPAVAVASISAPTATITTTRSPDITPDVLTIVVAAPVVHVPVWGKVPRSTDDDWTETTRDSSDSFSKVPRSTDDDWTVINRNA